MTNQMKLAGFRQSIMKQAQKELDAIAAEKSAYELSERAQMRDDVLKDTYHMLQREAETLRSGLASDCSAKALALKKELIALRRSMEDELFAEAAARLADFTDSPEYGDFLIRTVSGLARRCPFGDSVLLVRPQDIGYEQALSSAFGLPCMVRTDASIRIGGVVLHNAERNVILNDSLDDRLAAQRVWFRVHSGFTIQF